MLPVLTKESATSAHAKHPLSVPADYSLLYKHYLVAVVLLAFYGVAVCPFIETLNLPQLVLPIVTAFVLMSFIRQVLWEKLIATKNLERKISSIFKLDMLLFALFGVALGLFNFFAFNFPYESGAKIIVGMLSIGWFVSVDVALHNERYLSIWLKKNKKHLKQTRQYMSLTRKFSVFSFISLVVISVAMLLVVRKDVEWIIEQGNHINVQQAQLIIFVEFLFVLATLVLYLLRIIKSYTTNSSFFLKNQNQTMSLVASGDLTTQVPVTSNDEFGIMANLTNSMINDLIVQKDEIERTRDTTILVLSSLAETRDNETGEHLIRTQHYVKLLAEELSKDAKFKDLLSEEHIDLLYKSAPLHDIGKVGIPDSILLKPSKLNKDEFEIMKTHAALGAQAIRVAEEKMGENSFLNTAKEIAESHHEKWDGTGYPKGLKGEEIPLSGRLMALADVYDALVSKRIYKEATDHVQAKKIILDGSGKHFDPQIVRAFISVENKFVRFTNEC